MEFNDILQRMLERIPNRYDKRPGGVFYLLLAPVAWVLGQCFYVLNWAVSLLFPDTSEGEFLDLACSAFGWTGSPLPSRSAGSFAQIHPASPCPSLWGPDLGRRGWCTP